MGRKVVGRSQNKRKKNPNPESANAGRCAKDFLSNLQAIPETKAVCNADDGMEFEQDEDDMENDDEIEEVIVNNDEDCEDTDMVDHDDDGGEDDSQPKTVWDPRLHALPEGEELECDKSAYTFYHSLRVEWPCLTFDTIRDQLGAVRIRSPHTLTIAAGTQAANASDNKVCIWKISNLCATKFDDESDSDDDDDEEEMSGGQPVIVDREFRHPGAVNRLRSCPQFPHILGTWSDSGVVSIWDAQAHIKSLECAPRPNQPISDKIQPQFEYRGHEDEGYALDWSPVVAGRLATGDCKRGIRVWNQTGSSWEVSSSCYKGHTKSVEDIQWSPTEQGVFASCSIDKSIRIWDTRTSNRSMLSIEIAHNNDINVISWNQSVAHLLASGCDDGSFKVWDLRQFKAGRAAGFFQWHEKPITAIQWHPTQDSILAVTSEDDSCSIWDMSVELDKEEALLGKDAGGADLAGIDIPPQLAFVHRGQTQIKDIRFHPQIPSLITTTSYSGFNFFKPDNLEAV